MIELQSTLFEIILIFLLIFFNALFVAVEFSIVRVRNSELETLVRKGNIKAKNALDIKEHIELYIAATQIGITLVNLLLGWFGEGIISDKIISPILNYFSLNSALNRTLSLILGILTLTYFAIVIGEIVPKYLGIKYSNSIVLWFSIPLKIFYKIFKPFIWFLNISANGLIRLFGINPLTKDDAMHSEEEIRYLISEGRKTGVIDSTEHQLIEKIFDFNDKMARDIMVPRNRMIAIDIDENRDKLIQHIIDEGYSRIPVYKETIDNIIGVLYSKDLISAA